MQKIEIIPRLRGRTPAWMHDIHRAGRFVASASAAEDAQRLLGSLHSSDWKWLHLCGGETSPLELAKTVAARGWTFSDATSIAAYSGRNAIHRGPFWIFAGNCNEHSFVFRYWIYDEAVLAELRSLIPDVPVDADEPLPPAPPEWASDFDDAERYNVPVRSGLVAFYPVTAHRPEAMRVSYRYSGPDAWWYEVETHNPGLGRWIEQKTHSSQDEAIADALGWYPAPANA